MLDAQNISVTLGKKAILQAVDFTAKPGQVTAIVGPNGSGKTTLLKAITGDVAHKGSVRLNGQDITGMQPWELAAQRGVLSQATTLAFPFTVIEVVRIGLRDGSSGASDHLALLALNRVSLGQYANRFYQELSGGEQQRAQLARVLAQVWEPISNGVPRWLLLDEPVASLDIGHQLEVMNIARDYACSGGGVVTVMHDLNLTALYADEVAVLSGGALRAQGAPTEVLTDSVLSSAYGCALRVNTVPNSDDPFLLPHAAQSARSTQATS